VPYGENPSPADVQVAQDDHDQEAAEKDVHDHKAAHVEDSRTLDRKHGYANANARIPSSGRVMGLHVELLPWKSDQRISIEVLIY